MIVARTPMASPPVLMLPLLSGCAHGGFEKPPPCVPSASAASAPLEENIVERKAVLERALLALATRVDAREAVAVADNTIRTSLALREQYGIEGSALMHNLLVVSET